MKTYCISVKLAISTIVLLLCNLSVSAIEAVSLQNVATQNVSGSVHVLEDSAGTMLFSDIFTKPEDFHFEKSQNEKVVYIPFGHNVYWLHFKLYNATESEQEFFLEIKNATIDELTTYVVIDSMVRICKRTGDVITIDQRDVYSMHNLTPLRMESKMNYDIYIRVNTGGDALNIPVNCIKYERLFFQSNKQNLVIGLFAGLIVTLSIVSLLSIFIQNGGAIFIYFTLYALFNGVWLLYMEGVAYQYLWVSNAEVNNLFISFLPLLGCFFFIWYSLLYLRVKAFYPRLYSFVRWFNWGILSFVSFALINQIIWHVAEFQIIAYVTVLQITLGLLFFSTLMLSIVSGLMVRKNTRSAVFFLAAVIPLIISIQLFNMNALSLDMDITARNNFTKASLAWQILVLFLAMFDQIRRSQLLSSKTIEESRQKYFDILENSTEAIFVVQDGFIKFTNSQLSVFLKVIADSLINLPVELMAHIEDRDALLRYLLEREVEDTEEQHFVFRTNEAYNKNSWMELNAILIQWEGADAMLCLMNDVTQRVVNEEERKKLEQQLFQSQKLETVGTLAGGVAHEINNILTPILGYSDMLLDDMSKDHEYRGDVEAIHHSAQRAKDVVKQILSFSRQIDVNREVITAQKVIDMVGTMLHASKQASVSIQYDVRTPDALLNVNVTQIEQVILNLCNNASHAIKHAHGLINVSVDIVDGSADENKSKLKPIVYVCITVKDNGTGMNEDTVKRIFEPFFTTKKVGEGTGLGLSVVHGIVKNHGGIIQVASQLGIGTQFDIYLPLHLHKDDALSELKTIPQTMFGTESVLVIDDESEITTIIKRALTHLGYKVTTFGNSLDALREIERNPLLFDVIISDLQMPRLSGRELMTSAKRVNPTLKFIILTGMFEQQIDRRLFPAEYCRVMTKPIDLKELSSVVRNLLVE